MNSEFTQRLEKIEHALQEALLDASDKKSAGSKMQSAIALLTEPCASLLAGGGKRWRPLMMVLAYELAGGRDDSIYRLAPLVEGIHTASLIHDDIEDSSELRRGMPAAHVAYGLDSALNAGSWLYFRSLQSIAAYNAPPDIQADLYRAALFHIAALHEGQALDIHWHRNPDFFPAQQDYERMIRLKTGALAVLAVYTGMRAAGKSCAEAYTFSEFAADIGVGFQIADDVKNITAGNAGKARGDDIVEGKKSLPVILHIEKHPEDAAAITAYFQQARTEGISSPAVEKVIAMLHHSGAIAQAGERGAAAIRGVFNRISEYCGNREPNLFAALFEHMQTW